MRGDVCYSEYTAIFCMYVVMVVKLLEGQILHVCGDVSYSIYRDSYCMYMVMLVTLCRGLHTACVW